MHSNPRQKIGATLTGDVLEIGPGSSPFPTAPGAMVKFADRSVEGGRDANWPELKGSACGPDAHFDVNLDTDNLTVIPDCSFDAVVASHVIEHLANPLKSICEFERVLRPNGRLVLIVPDRSYTFDATRVPTSFSHVFEEFQNNITEVNEDHIIEFCSAIYSLPPIHPDPVREWHNPDKLDAELFTLHRKRSIHVHCWSAVEFASLIAGSLANGLMSWRFSSAYFANDYLGSNEFGIVIQKSSREDPKKLCSSFIEMWTNAFFADGKRDPHQIVELGKVLQCDVGYKKEFSELPMIPLAILAKELISSREKNHKLLQDVHKTVIDHKVEVERLERAIQAAQKSSVDYESKIECLEQLVHGLMKSSSWRVTAPFRKVCNLIRKA